MKFTIIRFDSIESTNDEAIRQAKMGAEEGLCIIANSQTKGRGRHGRKWVSEKGAGLYLSVILRPRIPSIRLPLITLAASISIHESLKTEFGLSPDIKWANDVLIEGKKISGILAETAETQNGIAVVLGIGINLLRSAVPPGLEASATSIESEHGAPPGMEIFFSVLSRNIALYYELLCGEEGGSIILDEWSRRSSYAFGKPIKATLHDKTLIGETRGLNEDGSLRVELDSGETISIHAGDIERIRAA